MASLTDLLRYQSPTVRQERRSVFNPGGVPGNMRQEQYRNVVEMGGGGAFWGGGRSNPLDDLLKGYDRESKQLTEKLKSIYDGYTGSYEEMEGRVRPIMDLIEQDIGKFEDYLGDYEGLISGMEGDFLDSIIIDPSATRTRGEYMGNVAAQFDAAQDAQRRQAIQQGQNPYANQGGQRSMALQRAGAMAGAANQAYGDWRQQYNQDIQAQQRANAMYADLFGQRGQMMGDLLRARGGLMGAEQGLLDTRLAAEQARAGGYEGLLGLTEQRRREAIQLGQQQAEANRQAQSEWNQMRGSLKGQNWYNPNWNAGGSETWS